MSIAKVRRKQVNLKAVIILSAVTAVLGVAVFIVHGVQVRRTAGDLREQANLFKDDAQKESLKREPDFAKKNSLDQSAIKALQQYLGLVPEDTKALATLGLWLADTAQGPLAKIQAFKVLKQAGRRDESRTDLWRKAAEIALELGWFADAKDSLGNIKGEDVEILYLKAQAAMGLKEYKGKKDAGDGGEDGAEDFYKEGLAKGPNEELRTSLAVGYAYLIRNEFIPDLDNQSLTKEKREDQLRKLIDTANGLIGDLIKDQGNSAGARLAAANYYRTYRTYRINENKEIEFVDQFDDAQEQAELGLKLLDAQIKQTDQDIKKLPRLKLQHTAGFLLAGEIAQAQANKATAKKLTETAKTHTGKARDLFSTGLELYPQDTALILALATLELQQDNSTAAATLLDRALKKLPGRIDHLLTLGNLLVDVKCAGCADKARIVITALKKDNLEPFADFLAARLEAQDQNWNKVRELLESTRTHPVLKLPASKLLDLPPRIEILLGDAHGALGNPDQQINAYKRAVDLAPKMLLAQLRLASAEAAAGKLDAAIKRYEKIADPDPMQKLALVRLRIEQIRNAPDGKQNWAQTEELLKELMQKTETSGSATLLAVQVLASQGKLKEAKELAVKIRDEDVKEIAPWVLLVGLAQAQAEKSPDVLKILDDAEKKAGPQVEWVLLRADHLVKNDPAKAKQQLPAFEKAAAQFSLAADKDRLLLGLGEIYLTLNLDSVKPKSKSGEKQVPWGQAQTIRLWATVAKNQPHNILLRFRLLELAFAMQQEGELKTWLKEIQDIEGGVGPFSSYGKAAWLLLTFDGSKAKNLDDAHAQLAVSGKLRPSWSRVPWLDGMIYEQQRQYDKALQNYQKALEMGDNRLILYKQAAMLYNAQGKAAEANKLLQQLPKSVRENEAFAKDTVHAIIFNPADKKNHEKAWEIAKDYTKDSDNYKDFLWLGQVALMAKMPDKAAEAFTTAREKAEQAFKANKDVTEEEVLRTWIFLLEHLARTDATKAEAAAQLEVAKQTLKKSQFALVAGPYQDALGDKKEAEKYYQAALDQMKSSGKFDAGVLRKVAEFYGRHKEYAKAEPLIEKILELDTAEAKQMAPWARRTLAFVLSMDHGSYAKFKKALKLIDENRVDGQLSVQDRQILAQVLAQHPGHRGEAIAVLEKLSSDVGGLPEGLRFDLGKLYYAEQRWDEASAQAKILLQSAEPKTPAHAAYLALNASSLLKQGKNLAASQQINKMVELYPKSFATIELQARYLHATKRPGEALDLLTSYVKDAKTDKKDPGLTVATLLEDLSKTAHGVAKTDYLKEARSLYEKYVSSSDDPKAPLSFAVFLAKHTPGNFESDDDKKAVAKAFPGKGKRLDEALDLCEKALGKGQPDAVGLTCVEVLHLGTADVKPQHVKRVVGWLKQTLADRPKDRVVPLLLADVYAFQGQNDEAIQLYRKALVNNPNDPIALNNLAFLLAFDKSTWSEGKEMIDKAIAQAGPHAGLLDTRAVLWLQQQQPKKAIEDAKAAIVQEPNSTHYYHLAQAYFRDGDLTKAADMFKQAVELGLTRESLPQLEQAAFQEMSERFAKAP